MKAIINGLMHIAKVQEIHGRLLRDILAAVAPTPKEDGGSPLEIALQGIFRAIEKNTEVLLRIEAHMNDAPRP